MKSSTSESKPFQSRNSRLSQAERTAEPFQIETAVLNRALGRMNQPYESVRIDRFVFGLTSCSIRLRQSNRTAKVLLRFI